MSTSPLRGNAKTRKPASSLAPGEVSAFPRIRVDDHDGAGNPNVQPGARELDYALDRFTTRLRARLDAGAREYGSTTFERPAAELIDEIQQELEDVAGWGFVLWVRLDRLRAHVARATAEGEHHE